ncbi:MAG: phenylalanine--tRNA ligase subunit beta [Caldisericum exile]
MIVSYKLLKELVDFPYTPRELSEKLTHIGIEVEKIETVEKRFENVVSAKVLEIYPIEGTRLFKAKVDIGDSIFDVITAATNVKTNDIVPYAKVNSKISDGRVIKEREFEGHISQGMLLSYSELGIDSDSLSNEEKNGIFILPYDTPIGVNFEKLFPIEDTYLELSLLPDRADAFYVLGVARWIEILLARDEGRRADFDKFTFEVFNDENLPQTPFPVEILHKEHCSFYSGRLIKNVTIKKSSYKLRKKLFSLRIRPINNIVDITNYVARMYGQPLHAFDFDKLKGKIVVRLARDGEKIKTLDEVERNLTSKNLLITDETGPIAIAGVMGGLDTAVSESTKNIFLESAYFTPSTISRSSRSLGLITDASSIFEKGVDPQFTPTASLVATKMILDEGGGSAFKDRVADFRKPKESVRLRVNKASNLLGEEITPLEIRKYFDMEGFKYSESEGVFSVIPPSFRQDISIEEDLIEEIVRMRGYNEFAEKPIIAPLRSGTFEPILKFNSELREILLRLGLNEILTSTLTNKEALSKFGLYERDYIIELLNPLTEDMSVLRPTLFVGSYEVAERNLNVNIENLALFEIGKVFLKNGVEFTEEYRASIFLRGNRIFKNPYGRSLPYDYFYLKGLIESIFNEFGIDVQFEKFELPYMHPYQTSKVIVNDVFFGYLGKINPDILDDAYFAELKINELLKASILDKKFSQFSIYPPVKRDIAIIVDKDVQESLVRRAIKNSNIKELKSITLFDIYEGKPLPEGKKNLAYSLEFVSYERTLQGSEVDEFMKSIEERIINEVGGVVRKNE